MDPKQLEYFQALYQSGNITKTAESLYMTRQALTLRIRKLEQEVGAQLFRRTKNGLVPTAAADILHAYIPRQKALWDSCLREIRRSKAKKILRVATHLMYLTAEEIRYIKDFQLQEGGCQVRLVNITDSNRCPILLEEGEVDLAITHKPPNSARFHCKKLGDEETWLIMGRDNPLACGAGDIDFLKEMGGQNVLFVSMETLREVEPILQEQGSVCTYLESDRVLLEQSIKSDGGVFSIPAHSRHNFMDGDMLARRLKNFPVVNGSYFLYERETPEVLQFIEYFCRQW